MASTGADLQALLDMGFSENRAKRALAKSGNKGIEAAMDWLSIHQDDPDIDDPMPEEQPQPPTTPADAEAPAAAADSPAAPPAEDASTEPKSLKCDDCGRLFRGAAEAEFHATKSGHANFSQSTEEIRQLTPEEKAEQLRQLEVKLAAKREARDAEERRAELDRERKRRTDGRSLAKWRDESAEQEMKRAAEARRREKEEERAYLARIRERYARDRAELEARELPAPSQQPQQQQPQQPQPQPPQAPVGDTCRLQIRLPGGGPPLTAQFGAKESLASVACYVRTHRPDGRSGDAFSFMTMLPKRLFTDEDMDKPLYALDLCPSAVLVARPL